MSFFVLFKLLFFVFNNTRAIHGLHTYDTLMKKEMSKKRKVLCTGMGSIVMRVWKLCFNI
jgi:hypothetical protein